MRIEKLYRRRDNSLVRVVFRCVGTHRSECQAYTANVCGDVANFAPLAACAGLSPDASFAFVCEHLTDLVYVATVRNTIS